MKDASEWHWNQWKWHKKRAGKTGWHRNQARWHSKRIRFTYLVTRTFRKHRKALLRNIISSNAIYQRLLQR